MSCVDLVTRYRPHSIACKTRMHQTWVQARSTGNLEYSRTYPATKAMTCITSRMTGKSGAALPAATTFALHTGDPQRFGRYVASSRPENPPARRRLPRVRAPIVEWRAVPIPRPNQDLGFDGS